MTRAISLVAPLMLLAGLPVLAAPATPADDIFDWLQQARDRKGVAPVQRRPDLDRVARERAEDIADLPHAQRLSLDEPIGERLREAGVVRFRHATVHMNMNRGYHEPAAALFEAWQEYRQGWRTAMGREIDGVGLATVRADDGWVILTAVLVEDLTVPADLGQLERETMERINEVRRKHGLNNLQPITDLDSIARAHSEDMARRSYIAHQSPEGRVASDRVQAAGQTFRALAENLYMGRGMTRPARDAVRGWMDSKGHRENILDARFTHTGMGVAIDPEGTIYFTQLFMTPK